MMKEKKMSRYMKIYLSVLAFFVVLLIIAAIILWNLLSAYEETRPKHVAKKVFDDYFTSMKIGQLIEAYEPEKLEFETVEGFNQKYAETVDPKGFDYFSVSVDEQGNEQFAVSYDNKRIAYFTVSPTEKEASFGFNYYELTDAEVFVAGYPDVSVVLPKGGVLTVNGKKLEEKYISEKDIKDKSYDYMPKDVEGILYDKYTVSGLLFEPTVSATDKDGNKLDLVYNENEECYVTPVVYDTELEKAQSSYCIKIATEYTKFLSNDSYFGAVGAYLDKNYEIYKRVRSIQVNWVRDHSGYDIYNEKATEFVKYADDVFSCRVTLTEKLTRPGYKDHVENIDITLYLHKVGNKYLVYEMVNN